MRDIPLIYMLIPCFNEEKVLPVTIPLFISKLDALISAGLIHKDSRILIINDGSYDNTLSIIRQHIRKNGRISCLSLKKNKGHNNALFIGMMKVRNKCDAIISLDCDGQNDLKATDKFLAKYMEGADIVYGVRKSREGERILKRLFVIYFYLLMELLGVRIIKGHADYRLVSRSALLKLSHYRNKHFIFLRGIFPSFGLKEAIVYYDCLKRISGHSAYGFYRMCRLGIQAILWRLSV